MLHCVPSYAASCRDAHGKFIKCPPKAAPATTGARCKDAKGKFAKCGTPGAMPIAAHTTKTTMVKTSTTTKTKRH